MNSRNKKPLIITLTIIGIIVLAAGIFFASYYVFIGKSNVSYEKSVSTYIKGINTINTSISKYSKDQSIDTAKIKKDLPADIDSLIEIKEKLQEVSPTEKFIKNHNSLIEGVNSNIMLYKQIVAALNNPQGKDIPAAMDAMTKYQNDAMNYYSLVGLKGNEVTIPKETINLVNGVYSYLSEMNRIQRDIDVRNAQAQEYIDAVDKVTTQFNNIKTDFSAQVAKVRANNGTYEGVLALIDKNSDDLDNIKSAIVNIIPPQSNNSNNNIARTSLNNFNKVLADYSSYLQSFKYALQTEKTEAGNNKTLTPEQITSLYSTATSRYSDVYNDYQTFLNSYNSFKASLVSK